jgi:hypothetical protein
VSKPLAATVLCRVEFVLPTIGLVLRTPRENLSGKEDAQEHVQSCFSLSICSLLSRLNFCLPWSFLRTIDVLR